LIEIVPLYLYVGKLINGCSGAIAAGALALLLGGCGGGGSVALSQPTVVHVIWEDSPSIGQLRLTVTDNFHFHNQKTVSRADGNTDVELLLPPGEVGQLVIDGLDPSGNEITEYVLPKATAATTVRVGGTPTRADVYFTRGGIVQQQSLNHSSLRLRVGVGCNCAPLPMDSQGAVIVRPYNEYSFGFTNASVVDLQPWFVIGGMAPGSTEATLQYQSSALANFNIQITP